MSKANILWTEKYRPKTLHEIIGQKNAVEALRRWLNDFLKGKTRKAALLYGPPGSGKTAAALALCNDYNLDPIELNASDFRTAKSIESFLLPSLSSLSIFDNKKKLIIFDEVDGLTKSEYSAVRSIRKIIESGLCPVILIANDPYKPPLSQLRDIVVEIRFYRLPWSLVVRVLNEIAAKEKVKVSPVVIKKIASVSHGDLRAAILSLQGIASLKDPSEGSRLLMSRDLEKNIFDFLSALFLGSPEAAKSVLRTLDVDYSMLLRWVEENFPSVCSSPGEIECCVDKLSKASIFEKRITETGSWRFLSYFFDMLVFSSSCRTKKLGTRPRFRYPSLIKMLSKISSEEGYKKSVSLKLAKALHCSSKTIMKDFLPLIQFILNDETKISLFARRYNLDKKTVKKLVAQY